MGILEAYRGQEENLQQQPKAGKRIVENVGKVQIPAQDRLARNIELVGLICVPAQADGAC